MDISSCVELIGQGLERCGNLRRWNSNPRSKSKLKWTNWNPMTPTGSGEQDIKRKVMTIGNNYNLVETWEIEWKNAIDYHLLFDSGKPRMKGWRQDIKMAANKMAHDFIHTRIQTWRNLENNLPQSFVGTNSCRNVHRQGSSFLTFLVMHG